MAEYINKADIIKLINDSFFDLGVSDDRMNMLTEVEELKTVDIIQCKDCKHFTRDISCVEGHYDGCDEWTDNGNEIMVAEDDFCSYAEVRDDA